MQNCIQNIPFLKYAGITISHLTYECFTIVHKPHIITIIIIPPSIRTSWLVLRVTKQFFCLYKGLPKNFLPLDSNFTILLYNFFYSDVKKLLLEKFVIL